MTTHGAPPAMLAYARTSKLRGDLVRSHMYEITFACQAGAVLRTAAPRFDVVHVHLAASSPGQ